VTLPSSDRASERPGLHFTGGKLANTIVQHVIGDGVVFTIGVWLGRIGVG
jgi:hypothetical protein